VKGGVKGWSCCAEDTHQIDRDATSALVDGVLQQFEEVEVCSLARAARDEATHLRGA
jgi:hypothetical protein